MHGFPAHARIGAIPSFTGRMVFILPVKVFAQWNSFYIWKHVFQCFSFFQNRRKRNPVLEGCFSLIQHFRKNTTSGGYANPANRGFIVNPITKIALNSKKEH
jgi:hypothetical protein